MSLSKRKIVDPVESYRALFPEDEVYEEEFETSQHEEDLSLFQIYLQLKNFIEKGEYPKSFKSQDQIRNWLKSFPRALKELFSEPKEFILTLAEIIVNYGASSNQDKISKLISPEDVILLSEDYFRFVFDIPVDPKREEDQIDKARHLLRVENKIISYFFNLRSCVHYVEKDIEILGELRKSLKDSESQIRQMNKDVRSLKVEPFIVEGKPKKFSPHGTQDVILEKLEGLEEQLEECEEGSEKRLKILAAKEILEKDLEICTHNEYIKTTIAQKKKRVSELGKENREYREKVKDLEGECELDRMMLARAEALKEMKIKNKLEKEFAKIPKIDLEGAIDGNPVDGEMISVGAAARLAEVMKSSIAPVTNVSLDPQISMPQMPLSGGEAPVEMVSRNFKPNVDYTHKDKDQLIDLIYDCDLKKMTFEKTAETLEAMALKNPEQVAKILAEKVSDPVFYS